jgi:hypothetical protein
MLHDLSHDKPGESGADASATGEHLARQQAIRQIERRRRFWFRATAGTVGMIILAVIWAIAEYNNAGGWPTSGFSQSSGIPNVWNYWIIYPAIVWVLATAADAWRVFGRKPISEDQIKHEMERQAGQR